MTLFQPFSKRVGFTSMLVGAIVACASPDVQAMLLGVVEFVGVSPRVAAYIPYITKAIGLLAVIGTWLSHSATGMGGKPTEIAPS